MVNASIAASNSKYEALEKIFAIGVEKLPKQEMEINVHVLKAKTKGRKR
jgi:hypothetical protein